MVKLISLKKSDQFKTILKGNRIHTNFFSVFFNKNIKKSKNNNVLNISFVIKKKIGNNVQQAIVINLTKIKGAINRDYTYIVFGKTKAYSGNYNILLSEMSKVLKKIK